ncbi:MAG: hypothetical protein MJY77_05770 [Bacteroidaceae bacterium]|nr:hypothetical protein [Bacteroidaceae bacterium]
MGLHDSSDILRLSKSQRDAFNCETPADIFPEYYLLRVDKFNAIARTPLDEWISFLKSGEIPADATAPGLQEARERLRVESLNDAELRSYYHRLDNQRYQRSVIETGRFEGRMEGREEGLAAGKEIGHAEGMALIKYQNYKRKQAATPRVGRGFEGKMYRDFEPKAGLEPAQASLRFASF